MATFHFEVKSGRNAYDHSLYVARAGYHRKRNDLVLRAHGNMPAWAGDNPGAFWKAAEKFERRNGAAYREAIIALPHELTEDQTNDLVKDLVSSLAADRPFQLAVHAPVSSLEGQRNPHLHLLTCDRLDDGLERPPEKFFSRYNARHPERGGRKKAGGGLNRMQLRDELIARRKQIAETINQHLELNGHCQRVDSRRLTEQGIRRKAERHLGPFAIKQMSENEKSQYVSLRRDLAGN